MTIHCVVRLFAEDTMHCDCHVIVCNLYFQGLIVKGRFALKIRLQEKLVRSSSFLEDCVFCLSSILVRLEFHCTAVDKLTDSSDQYSAYMYG